MTNGKYRVLLLDTKFRNPNHYICIALREALKRSSHIECVVEAGPLDAISRAYANSCNLFVAFDGEELDQTLCKRLAQACGRSLLWVTEDPYEVSVNKRNALIFDLIFTNDSSSVMEYGAKGRHLPLAGALEFHNIPVLPAEKPLRYDLFFAGTAWPNRTAFVRSVIGEMPSEWKFKLALPVNEHLPPRNVDLPESLVSWRTSPPDFGRFVNCSAVTILLPRVFSASGGRQFAETPPPRLFEAALAGGVQLVQEGLAEAAGSFEPEREIVLFSDGHDFVRKASEVITDRQYRNRVATAARERALRDHTYDQRVATMLTELTKLPAHALAKVRTDNELPGTNRKTVLFVSHNYISRGDFGGVEIYLDRLRAEIGDELNVLFYLRGGPGEQFESLLLSQDYTLLKRYTFRDAFDVGMLSSPEREQAFHALLVENRVDFVHFHHFIGHPPSLVYMARQLGVPTAITFHDYWAVCNEYQLISFNGAFCGAPNVSLSQCDVCLSKKHEFAPGSQAARRQFWNGVLAATDLLIFSTPGVRDLVSTTYPAVREHEGVRLLPVPILDGEPVQRVATHSGGNNERGRWSLKVAMLGNVTAGKGGDLFAPTVAALAHAPVEFHVFGRLDPAFAYLNNKKQFPNLIVHGPYVADQLPDSLLQCDVSLHTSIWPETYCLTLSEAWQNGIVPIVSDIGALGERVEHGRNGIKIRVGQAGDLISAVRLLAEDRSQLAKLRSNISGKLYETLTPHVTALLGEYRKRFRDLPHEATTGATVHGGGIAEFGIVLQAPSWVQNSGLSRAAIFGGTGARSSLVTLTRAIVPARVRSAIKRSKLRNVHAFYTHHGFKKTASLLVKHGKRILWKR
ncbi:glycosyltransferase [Paraburkholderia sp. DHOC27]|uniref:glycosyltransferase family protein n=1 Tax=Paraburkholderia sp. DHOC27 TaxID=2303330 RepID=UPI000E3CAD86|nr:glycosyltransferase [Paraburkholderia sp. DHOC27]RFU45984.1 glycosyltransferase [Paraburkholderia sp. DHOC27]